MMSEMFSERMPSGEAKQEQKVDAFARERSRLQEIAKTPAAKWVTMAALALSTQGCKQFVGIVTGEGTAVSGVRSLSVGAERSVTIGIDDDSVGNLETNESKLQLQPDIKGPGDLLWWRKGEGLYVPPVIEKKMPKRQQTALSHQPRVTFNNEKAPRMPVSYAHPHPGEEPGKLMQRGYEMLSPVLGDEEGVRIQWHVAQKWDRKSDQTGTNAIVPVPSDRKRLNELNRGQRTLAELSGSTGGFILGQLVDLNHARGRLQEMTEDLYQPGPSSDIAIRCSPMLPMETSAIKDSDFEAHMIELAKIVPGDFAYLSKETSPRKDGFLDHASSVVEAQTDDAQGRSEAVEKVVTKLSSLGLNEMRVHIVRDDEGKIKVVGVLDDPSVKVNAKKQLTYAF